MPALTHDTSARLVTPLQLHTCVSGLISRKVICLAGAPMSKSSWSRSSGSGVLRSNDCIRYGALLMSPRRMPPTSRPSRTMSFLYVPRFASENWTTSSSGYWGSTSPIEATSTPMTFSLVATREP